MKQNRIPHNRKASMPNASSLIESTALDSNQIDAIKRFHGEG
jgi:hypothetical protein